MQEDELIDLLFPDMIKYYLEKYKNDEDSKNYLLGMQCDDIKYFKLSKLPYAKIRLGLYYLDKNKIKLGMYYIIKSGVYLDICPNTATLINLYSCLCIYRCNLFKLNKKYSYYLKKYSKCDYYYYGKRKYFKCFLKEYGYIKNVSNKIDYIFLILFKK